MISKCSPTSFSHDMIKNQMITNYILCDISTWRVRLVDFLKVPSDLRYSLNLQRNRKLMYIFTERYKLLRKIYNCNSPGDLHPSMLRQNLCINCCFRLYRRLSQCSIPKDIKNIKLLQNSELQFDKSKQFFHSGEGKRGFNQSVFVIILKRNRYMDLYCTIY